MSISDRYDEFQKDAVKAIRNDFVDKLNGRYLLVIPTGGGKTFTAVKAINDLYLNNVLSRNTDKVYWVAHRKELLTQAEATFVKYSNQSGIENICGEDVELCMLSEMQHKITNNSLKLVVIDEAHHGAANSYKKIFDRKDIGILGLTATPTRHDGKPLEFEKESFSIGFPDLVKKGIILKPHIHKIDGDSFDIADFSDDDLEALNTTSRNYKIVQSIKQNTHIFHKIIIYVGTIKHAQDLYAYICDSDVANDYDSISFVAGNNNSRNQDRDTFIEQEKLYDRSILVNVQVLSEGYDDPKVNTVIMATPTRSKLYYMQAMGRAIRLCPENILKKAHIVEIEDKLPNIRYRIDNRWLYSDVSDTLEPAVVDLTYSNESEFASLLHEIRLQFKVHNDLSCSRFDVSNRYSMLLFKRYVTADTYDHFGLLISNTNRLAISNMFNYISERASKYRTKKYNNHETIFTGIGRDAISVTGSGSDRMVIFDAMMNASMVCDGVPEALDFIKKGYPWLTFITMTYKSKDVIPDDLSAFLDDVINKDEIIDLISTNAYEADSCLVKLPLPLMSFVGKILTRNEFEQLKSVIDKLNNIKVTHKDTDHRREVDSIIADAILPIEVSYCRTLYLIARDNINYSYALRGHNE